MTRRAGGPHLHRTGRRLASGLLALALLGGCASITPSGAPPGGGDGVVVHVVDGDTVDIAFGDTEERVRLVGVDTPESVARDRPVQCFGAEASSFLQTLLPAGTEVRVERDVEARDRYGRLLGYVYRRGDDLLVNLALVEHGYADAVSFGDNEALLGTLVAAEVDARDAGRGLWSACGGPDVDIAPPPG